MIAVQDLPPLNAILNSTATVLLLIGHSKIKQHKIEQHRRIDDCCVFSVGAVSDFISDVSLRGGNGSFRKARVSADRLSLDIDYAYVLAAIVPFLAIITLIFGLKRRDAKHRRIARWTYPIWLYVSVTGVIVVLLLYQVQPRL